MATPRQHIVKLNLSMMRMPLKLAQAKETMTAFNSKWKYEILAVRLIVCVHFVVLQMTAMKYTNVY